MPRPTVHPTVAFKTYRDAPKQLLQHRMDRRLDIDSAVHPTVIFETYSTAPSEKSSAPDGPSVYSVGALSGFLGSTTILGSVSDRMIRRLRRGRPSVHPTVPLFQETFSNG
jgi:hypothetical protein